MEKLVILFNEWWIDGKVKRAKNTREVLSWLTLNKEFSRITSFILCLIIFLTYGFSPTVLPQPVEAYSLTLVVSTDSDWTLITLNNARIVVTNYTVVLGESAPRLSYDVNPSFIHISKKQYDETNVTMIFNILLSVEGKPVGLTIEKGALGNTTLRFLEEEKEIMLIISSDMIHYFNISEIVERLKPTIVNVSRLLVKPMVLAFYYPWYGNPLGRSGLLFHWGDITYNDISSSTFYPLIGPYDSYDAALIKAHMLLAKSSGIDSFICSWWGINSFEDNAFKEILSVADEENFTVTVYYESFRMMTRQQIVEELSYVLKNYSNSSSFLKLNGRPVIFVYAVGAYNRDPWFWRGILDEVRHSTGVNAIFVADTFDTSYLLAFDGLHTYNPIGISNLTQSYCDTAKLVRLLGKIWAGTVVPGYDDRKVNHPGTYIGRENGRYYNNTWSGTMTSNPDMVLICTWNEWHEGTNIEPSREFRFDYLRLTRYWALRLKNESIVTPSFTPLINLNSFNDKKVLQLRNDGTGDAFAINIMLNSNKDYNVGNTIYVQINETCKLLFIPLLCRNTTYDILILDNEEIALSISGFYYSPIGEKYSLEGRTIEIAEVREYYAALLIFLGLLIFSCLLLLFYYRKRRKTMS